MADQSDRLVRSNDAESGHAISHLPCWARREDMLDGFAVLDTVNVISLLPSGTLRSKFWKSSVRVPKLAFGFRDLVY